MELCNLPTYPEFDDAGNVVFVVDHDAWRAEVEAFGRAWTNATPSIYPTPSIFGGDDHG